MDYLLLPEFHEIWLKHEDMYLRVFWLSLRNLAGRKRLVGDENKINELLYTITRKVCFEIEKKENWEIAYPCYELPKQPANERELTGGNKGKRPDFSCKFKNSFAESAEDGEIFFYVECKLIGKAESSNPLNKKYVAEGIKRFVSKTHEYGKRAPSGLMIGYMINMTPQTIQDDINTHIRKVLRGNPEIGFAFSDNEVISKTEQKLIRSEVLPKNFKLLHLWVDLRKNYKFESKKSKI